MYARVCGVCRTCEPSALRCSSPVCLQRVAPLPPLPSALGERQGESSLVRASRAPGAPRARLAELSAALSALPASGRGGHWVSVCPPQPLAGGRPIPGHAARAWPGRAVKDQFGGRLDLWRPAEAGVRSPGGRAAAIGLVGLQLREPPGHPRVQREGEGMASVFMCGVEDLLFSGSRFVWNLTVSTLRRWYTERLRACHQVLRTWCGLREVYQVSRGARRPRALAGCLALLGNRFHLYDFIVPLPPPLSFSTPSRLLDSWVKS